MPFTDDQIRAAVLNLFQKYDTNRSGYLEESECEPIFNDLKQQLASKKLYTSQQIDDIISSIDMNQDRRLTLDQVYLLMRRLNP